jgi:uncharacterized protein (DUF1697 family)
MPIYVALLRGVNVGQNALKMDRPRVLSAELGLKNARTYVQSGNLVFEARGASSHWAQMLERKLAGESRLPVAVLVRTAAEMGRIVAGNPFLKEKGVDPARLYVTFLPQAPARAALPTLDALNAGSDRLTCIGKEIFLHCPHGYGRTRLSNTVFEKLLAIKATTRNWNSVKKLHEICMD